MNDPLRLVLDTNVAVSALLWGGLPAQLLRLASTSHVRFHSSEQLIDELAQSLAKLKFAKRITKSGSTAAELAANYRELVSMIEHGDLPEPVSRDPDDDRVLACALAADANLIATGDDDLLVLGAWRGIAILSIRDCLEIIEETRSGVVNN